MFKLTKEHEGTRLWCVPTQNNVRRYGENKRDVLAQAELKTVTDVKRVYVSLGGVKYGLADYNRSETRAQYNSKSNSGWLVFESEEAFTNYKNLLVDREIIKSTLQRGYGELPLTDEQVSRIAEILREK